MKQYIIIIISLLYSSISYAQEKATYTKEEVYKLATQAAKDYMLKYFSKEEFNAYMKIKDNSSNISLKVPFDEITSNGIDKAWINGIEVTVEITIKNWHDFYPIELRKDFTVKENIAYYRNNENLTALFLTALKKYITAVNDNKINQSDSVYNYVVKNFPNQKWGKPKITRNSFPPYDYYYEVMEDSCSKCKRIYIDLCELKLLGENKVEMVPIKG